MPDFKRSDRVAAQIHKALSDVLLRGLKDPRVKPISITNITVSDDLRIARVRFVPMGGVGDPQEIEDGLRSASGYLSRQVAKQVRMKYSPKLSFFVDTQLSGSFDLLDALNKSEAANSGDGEE